MDLILITGSEGLIGESLVSHLKAQNFNIRKIDLRLHKNLNICTDILDEASLEKAIEGCIGVIHLAAVSRVISGQKNPSLCWLCNVDGTANIVKAALKSSKKPWVIYASSREVYGQQEIFPISEDAPLRPMNIYARSKVAAEQIILNASEQGLITAILRFSSVFGGPDDHVDRVIPAFCRAALLGTDLNLEGKENILDFTFVSDVVRGIESVMKTLKSTNKSLPPIHLTTGRALTLQQAAQIIIQAANSNSAMVEMPSRTFDVQKFYGNPLRAKNLLDWTPQFSFEEATKIFLSLLEGQLFKEMRFQRKHIL